jgi:ArsR family transcriptional regulator, zinc-responsive transcriptional repressor
MKTISNLAMTIPADDANQHAAVLDTAGELLRALAAPVRIAIVLQLREASRCVHELVDALEVPQPLVSQHLRILKAAGVVAGERAGREVHYRLVDHHLAEIVVAAVEHATEITEAVPRTHSEAAPRTHSEAAPRTHTDGHAR